MDSSGLLHRLQILLPNLFLSFIYGNFHIFIQSNLSIFPLWLLDFMTYLQADTIISGKAGYKIIFSIFS